MRKYWSAFALIATLVMISGCDLLLGERNLFEDLEPDLTAKYDASLTGDELLDALSDDTESASFYDDLSDSTEQTILTNLDAIIDDGTASDREVQDAVTYKTLIILNTTEAGEIVNSLASAAMNGSSDPTEVLAAVFAPISEMIRNPDPTEFNAFIGTLLDLKSDYDVLAGRSLSSLDVADAQTALVAYALSSVIDGIDTAQPGQGDPIAALKNSLELLTNDDPGDDSGAALTFDSGFDLTTELIGVDGAVDTPLEILFVAAGLDNLGTLIDQLNG